MNFEEKFIDMNIAALCEEYDKVCGQNKNLARITPSLIDGLKPVHRRALYVMFLKDQGRTYRKLATISGETFGRVHPHSPTAIEDALVGLAQDWNNIIPLIDGEGNWGSVSGDRAGASRYIKARLSEYAYKCFFEDWKESVVDMVMAYDEETKEPLYLPARYPNVLLNGSLGIGYGMAANVPPFNFKEIVDNAIILMNDPEADILIVPDSPTGSDIVSSNFKKISDQGNGVYTMRCKYEIDPDKNLIRITNLPYQVAVSNDNHNGVRDKIADIKEKGGLPELIQMQDFSGKTVDLRLTIRNDINPYKFMRKLIEQVGGLEKSYPVNITVTNDYESFDLSIKGLLIEWIRYRREQKRIVVSHKKTTLLAEQRTNDVKIFLMQEHVFPKTMNIFTTSRNEKEIEHRLIEEFRHSEIKMDSLQARVLASMQFKQLCGEAQEKCKERREELIKEIAEVDDILITPNGVDRVIIAELRDGIKRFGTPRKSNIVPKEISVEMEIAGECILQLSSDGMIVRRPATNVDEEPVPIDNNGFAVKVGNDCGFIAVDEDGFFSFVKVGELPIDQEVPINRYIKQRLGKIVALLPFDIESNRCVTLISKKGTMKKIRIADMKPMKRPCIDLLKGDKIVKGIVTALKTTRDILIYTLDGMGQRLDPNDLRVTSPLAKGGTGFKLGKEDEIIGCYAINPENEYLVYITTKGKLRLNLTEYLPMRDSKHDSMVRLINLNDRDKLHTVIGCNRLDNLQVFFDDGDNEVIDISKLEIGTMSSEPKKVTHKNAVSTNIVKAKLL